MCERFALLALKADKMFRISARLVLQSARGAGFDYRLRLHSGVTENILRHFDLIAYSFHVVIHEPAQGHRNQIDGRPLHVWTFSLPTSCRSGDAHDVLVLCVDPTRLSVDEAAVFFEEFRSVSGVNPSLLLMTRFAHCNRIFVLSPHCSGVVSRALLDVLIAASAVPTRGGSVG